MGMKRRCSLLAALLCWALLFPAAANAQAALSATNALGNAYHADTPFPPGASIFFACTLTEDIEDTPVLRLRLEGLSLAASSVRFLPAAAAEAPAQEADAAQEDEETAQADEGPEVVYGSDGCMLLFSEDIAAGDQILFQAAAAQEGHTTARIQLMQSASDAPLLDLTYAIDWQPPATPAPTAAPAGVNAAREQAAPPLWFAILIILLCAGGLFAVLRFVVLPRLKRLRMRQDVAVEAAAASTGEPDAPAGEPTEAPTSAGEPPQAAPAPQQAAPAPPLKQAAEGVPLFAKEEAPSPTPDEQAQ